MESLSRISSVLGIPKCADDCTLGQKYLGYARILVEVDITNDIPKEVGLEGMGEMYSYKR